MQLLLALRVRAKDREFVVINAGLRMELQAITAINVAAVLKNGDRNVRSVWHHTDLADLGFGLLCLSPSY